MRLQSFFKVLDSELEVVSLRGLQIGTRDVQHFYAKRPRNFFCPVAFRQSVPKMAFAAVS
jgi:hypothetical protein